MRNQTAIKTIRHGSLTLMLGLLSTPALCCGSMPGFAGFFYTVALIFVFAPFLLMIALIPVELLILRYIGSLGSKTWVAYAYCLVAKLAGVVVVTILLIKKWGTVGYEMDAIYSLVHFAVAFTGFYYIFKIKSDRAVLTAVLVSTVIPWPLSALLRVMATAIGGGH